MMDWLYDELDTSQKTRFQEHVEGCAHCRAELESLSRARALFEGVPSEEPPAALTNILLHEAAKRAPAVLVASQAARAARAHGERRGPLDWLSGVLGPAMAHPGLTAAASFILLVGVAGSLYLTGKYQVSEPQLGPSEARPLETAPTAISAEQGGGMAPDPAPAASAAAAPGVEGSEGYAADVAGGESEHDLDEVASRGNAARRDDAEANSERKRSSRASSSKDMASSGRQKKPSAGELRASTAADMASGAAAGASTGAQGDGRAGMLGGEGAPARPPYAQPPPPSQPMSTPLEMAASEAEDAPAQTAPREEPGTVSRQMSKKASQQKSSSDPALTWAREREQDLLAALRAGRCTQAARIAANLAERSPAYYRNRIEGLQELSSCRTEIAAERSRRAKAAKRKAAEAGEAANAVTK